MGLIGPYWVEFKGKDKGTPVLVVGEVHSGPCGPYWVEFQGKEDGRPVLVEGKVHSGPHWALLGGVPR